MCLPDRTTRSSGPPLLSIVTGAVMLLACIGGPALIGLAGSIAIGAILGPLAGILAIAACAGLPLLLRRRQRTRGPARPSTDDAAAASSNINTP
jgi:hypothetical protein